MAIVVVCQNCHQRFQVSEKFAGKKGPCPKCKTVLTIPAAGEEVKIHTPDHSEGGARGKSGKSVLKPVSRDKAQMPMWAWGAISGAVVVVLVVVFAMRGAEPATQNMVAALGAILLAPPLCLAGYSFLRNDELEPYSGKWLWIRTAICSAVYVLCWVVYGFMVPPEWTDEVWKWAFLGPAFGVAGATASFACFDLEFSNGFLHFVFYMGVTMCLAWMMGLPLFGS